MDVHNVFVLVFYGILVTNVDAACYSEESCLYTYLMTDYNSQVRPASGPSGTVDVEINLDFRSILNLDEKNEVLHSVLAITAIWDDHWLSWDLSNYSIPIILVNVQNLWLPDFAVTNSVDKFYQTTFLEDFRATIANDGFIAWEFGGIFKTSCSLDLSKYPFDTQKCTIIIQNWAYRASLVNITYASLETENLEANSLWELASSSVSSETYQLNGFDYPRVTYTFNLHRKSSYYTLNIILPCVLVLLAALGVFWLPADCGEKISLGITVLLAFSVFQIVIMDNTPVNSENTPFISQLVISIMAMATLSVVSSMATTYLHFKGSVTRVPVFIRVIAFKGLAKILFLTDDARAVKEALEQGDDDNVVRHFDNNVNVSATEIDTSEKRKQAPPPSELGAILNQLMQITKIMKDQKADEAVMDEWKLLAKIMDRIFFWTGSIMLFIILIVISV